MDLFEKTPKLKGDLVCLLLLIVLKESVFTSCVFQDVDVQGLAVRAGGQADAESLGAGNVKSSKSAAESLEERVQAYVHMLRPRLKKACLESSSNPKYHLEVRQMAMQGTGRFLGSCRLMSVLGIVQKSDEVPVGGSADAKADAESLGAGNVKSSKRRRCDAPPPAGDLDCTADAESLGAGVDTKLLAVGNTFKYKVLDDDSDKLNKFVRDVLSCETQWQKALASNDFEYVACTIAAIVEKSQIAQLCMHPPPTKKDNYVHGFCSRKLFLVCWLFGGLQGLDWGNVDKSKMLELLPDMTEQLASFPVDCTTVEISTFLFGRPDRLPFATMWPCLFHKSVDSKDEVFALQLMQSGAYVQKARSLRDSSGVEHHPANILRPLLKEALSGTKKR